MASTSSASFSGSDSDREAEDGLRASASAAGPSLAHLQGWQLEPQVDSIQFRDTSGGDFTHRLAASQHLYRIGPGTPSTSSSAWSESSSMAVSVHSRSKIANSTASGAYSARSIPSLCGSLATLNSGSSARTDRADSVVEQKYGLEQGEEGLAELPDPQGGRRRFECCFKFLNCAQHFQDIRQWDTHCRWHFRGRLPSPAVCPFRCGWRSASPTSDQAWDERLEHICEEHLHDDFACTEVRPVAAVLSYLYQVRVIDDYQYRQLRMHGSLDDDGPAVLHTAGRMRDDRRERTTGRRR